MGSNWWLRITFVLALLLLAARTLVPTFGPFLGEEFKKPEYLPAYKVQLERDDKKKIVKDKDGNPKILYRRHEKGKRKGQVIKDENGKPLAFFEKKDGRCQLEYKYDPIYEYEYEVEVDPKTKQPKLDPKTKKPVYKKGDDGKLVPKKDKKGKPILAKGTDGKFIIRKDDKGKPVISLDQKGNFVIPKSNGKALFQIDASKRFMASVKYMMVPKLNNKGREVRVDGKAVMVRAQMTDEAWSECILPKWYSTLVPYKKRLRLGLDLQGGTHLVLRVDVDKAIARKVGQLAEDMVTFLKRKKITIRKSDVFHDPSQMHVEIKWKSNRDFRKLQKTLEDWRDTLRIRMGTKKDTVDVRFKDEKIKKDREAAVTQAIEIIRGRIDSLGVSEPSISKFGETDIVIQLPGLKNPQRAKELIGKTALLTFHVVEDDHQDANTIYTEMKKDAPKGATAVFTSYNRPADSKTPLGYDRGFQSTDRSSLLRWIEKWNKKFLVGFAERNYARQYMLMLGRYDSGQTDRKEDMPWRTYLLWREASITGEMLEEARPQLDPQTNTPEVGLNFNLLGADKFEDMTGKHVGHRFAIVLEGKVNSAPVIQTRIGGGKARITLGGGGKGYEDSLQEAKDLAFVLKSGSLPAPVDILYEKTIGPALGLDSIKRGVSSVLIGLALVLIFMILYYRGSGFNAVFALVLNMVFLLSIMASFGAVLTLPGIAGILLTVGMAVDANILIFERIREELHAGKAVRIAVQNGYDKAFVTILDANITTAIAGIVLYQYGSGPVRGFAVTLLIGIVCSVFTALFVTKLVFLAFVNRKSVHNLSI